MKRSIIAAGFAAFACSICYAQDYNAEVTIGYTTGETDSDSGFDIDNDSFNLGGTFYFNGVDTSLGPLAEAPFLDRASSISASYSDGEFDTPLGDFDYDNYEVSGRLVNKNNGWLFGLGYHNMDVDDTDSETDGYTLSVGHYIAQNTTLVFEYGSTDDDDGDWDTYTFSFEHSSALASGSHIHVEAELGLIDIDASGVDEVLVVGGEITYYPTNQLGFGTSLTFFDSDETEDQVWDIFGRWFVTEQVSLSLSYSLSDDDETDLETDTLNLEAALRF